MEYLGIETTSSVTVTSLPSTVKNPRRDIPERLPSAKEISCLSTLTLERITISLPSYFFY